MPLYAAGSLVGAASGELYHRAAIYDRMTNSGGWKHIMTNYRQSEINAAYARNPVHVSKAIRASGNASLFDVGTNVIQPFMSQEEK
ncbi:MAG: hypothetical protein P4L53_03870 [Candidatus Obscuribacterales bacterium]|nr:hypothetical protein [Candidatus Obscuribacterales bacterium]